MQPHRSNALDGAAAALTAARTRVVAVRPSWSWSHQPQGPPRVRGCTRAPRYFGPHPVYNREKSERTRAIRYNRMFMFAAGHHPRQTHSLLHRPRRPRMRSRAGQHSRYYPLRRRPQPRAARTRPRTTRCRSSRTCLGLGFVLEVELGYGLGLGLGRGRGLGLGLGLGLSLVSQCGAWQWPLAWPSALPSASPHVKTRPSTVIAMLLYVDTPTSATAAPTGSATRCAARAT